MHWVQFINNHRGIAANLRQREIDRIATVINSAEPCAQPDMSKGSHDDHQMSCSCVLYFVDLHFDVRCFRVSVGHRHTAASAWLAAGVDVRTVAEYLGHSDPGFTLRTYVHLMPGAADRARLAMDAFFQGTATTASALEVPSNG
jgi:hypothetical protein